MFRIFITPASGWNQWWAVRSGARAGVCRVKAAAAARVETAGSAPCPCHLSSHSAVLQCSSAPVLQCSHVGAEDDADMGTITATIYNYLRRIFAPTFILRPCWCRYCCRPGYDARQRIVYYVGSWLITQLQWVLKFSNFDIWTSIVTLFVKGISNWTWDACLCCIKFTDWWSVWFAYNLNHLSTKTCRRASQTLSICLNVKIGWVRWYEWYGQGTMWRSCKDAEWPHLPPARCRVPGKTLGNLQLGSSLVHYSH